MSHFLYVCVPVTFDHRLSDDFKVNHLAALPLTLDCPSWGWVSYKHILFQTEAMGLGQYSVSVFI